MLKLRLSIALALAAAAVAVAALMVPQGSVADPSTARPIVAKVHADWCGTCQRLEPTWQRIEAELGERAQLVVFDVTDREAVERSRASADALGLRAFLDANRAKTGTIAVLDGETREVVKSFKGVLDFDAYAAAVDEAGGS